MKKKIVTGTSILLVIIAIIIGAIFFIRKINQPESAKLKEGQSSSSTLTYQVNLTPKLETGHYASFDYPSSLISRQPSPAVGPVVETFYFTMRDVETWVLAISVSTLKDDQLSSDSDYQLRINNPSEYSQSTEDVNGQQVIIFSDTGVSGFSETAFLPDGDLVAAVSLQGDDSSGITPLQKSFNMVVNSWHWLE